MKKNKRWTIDMARESALRYKSRTEWFKKDPDAYNAAKRHGWFDSIVMGPKRKRWTEEEIIKEANKYKSLEEWRRENPSSLQAAYRREMTYKECRDRIAAALKKIKNK